MSSKQQSEVKVGSEAPANARGGQTLCPKCFDLVAYGHVCPEPDCPLSDEPESGLESKVYPELARANVMRMRGEYKLARDTCLSLLKQYPGNVDAHTLLGDIEAEEGDLVHAAQWYEMALDLRPESEVDARKLEAIRQRIQDREARQTAQQLGLPTTRPRAMLFAGVAILVVVASVAIAFVLGNRMQDSAAPRREIITTPIDAGKVEEKEPTSPPKIEPDVSPPIAAPAPSPESSPPPLAEDVALLTRLKADIPEGARLVSASQDPRDKSIQVTARADPGLEPRELAALLGVGVLDASPDCRRVTLRLVDPTALVLVADVRREAAEASREAIGDLGFGRHNREALQGVLTDVWPAQ